MSWNKPDPSIARRVGSPTAGKRHSGSVWILSCLIAVALIATGIILVRTENDAKQTAWTKKVADRPIRDLGQNVRKTQSPVEAPEPEEDAHKALVAKLRALTPDQRIEYLYEKAKNDPLRSEPASNRVFRTSLEQVMGWIFTCELGAKPPILPQMSIKDEAHLAEILISDNPISDSDSENVRKNKEMVQLAKKEFMKFIKDGGDPYDFLPYYHDQLRQAHEEWSMARKSALEIIRTDPDIAADYIKTLEAKLTSKGIRKLQIPKPLLERHNIELDD